MSIWAFLTQSEIEDAPDGEEGFTHLVRIAQERLDKRLALLSREDESEWHKIIETEMLFSRTVLNLGTSYDIAPFNDMEVPRANYNSNEYTEFRARLDDEVARLVLTNARKLKRDTIILPAAVKEKVRTHIHHIREHLAKANISDSKRSILERKLTEFEVALDKGRFNYVAAGRVAMEILSLTANVLGVADSATLHKLLSQTMQTVAEAKAEDDEKRLLPQSDPAPILLTDRITADRANQNGGDLDDDIPF